MVALTRVRDELVAVVEGVVLDVRDFLVERQTVLPVDHVPRLGVEPPPVLLDVEVPDGLAQQLVGVALVRVVGVRPPLVDDAEVVGLLAPVRKA